jgi:hypothetical protein
MKESIMTGKSRRGERLLSVLGVVLVAALAFSAMAAGSAQAKSWQIEGEPFAGSAEFKHQTVPAGTFKMEVPGRNIEIKCAPSGSGTISENTHIKDAVTLSECKVYNLETKVEVSKCISKGPVNFTFEGTGDKVSNTATGFLEFEKEKGCLIPLKTELTGLSLTQSYGPETYTLAVGGSGTGMYGAFAMTVTSSYSLTLVSGLPFGWENNHHWYIAGKEFLGEETLGSTGSFKMEIPSFSATFNCSETSKGLTAFGGNSVKGVLELSCVLVGQEKACHFNPVVLPLIGSGGWVHGNGTKYFLLTRELETPCTWFATAEIPIPTLNLKYGPEGSSVSVTSTGTTLFGAHTMYFTGTSSWKMTGAHAFEKFDWL